jgi:hypothetical protein
MADLHAVPPRIKRLIASWDRRDERLAEAKRKREGKKFLRAVAKGPEAIEKFMAARPKPADTPKDMSIQGIGARQEALVKALFQGASLSRAWRHAYGMTKHHVSVEKLLSSPMVRAMIELRLQNGGKLRGRLHQRVLDMLAPPLPDDPWGLL